MQIVQEWCIELLLQRVVTATSNTQRLVDRQVAHRMAETRGWRSSHLLDWLELTMDDSLFKHLRLHVSQLVHKFTLMVLSSKVVDTFLDGVRLNKNIDIILTY